ncbi:hypothetical protein KAFR_0K02190 [Kazachstania africana CBS 2517]|uniref:Sulfhydryl oxidase n=1 Tax=Kazachstania africana (strain ATCC 22294 / BCRC 22015 / CBS 2517 / CECT 1963 / NBRC 1671 / NRRL Y-8276) TaxID=1071382 RepID=H2B1S3_KAZAF|nr:hypothetical protein KAFR_0K02190 [Kazachstania africana CBS 2517]CCF60573.1 hypothetical protein KAFR_0K02190 [Kazachstania africana CBS 2517]
MGRNDVKIHIIRLTTILVMILIWILFSSMESTEIKTIREISNDPIVIPKIEDQSGNKHMKEVGRSAWFHFHTLLSQYPVERATEKHRSKLNELILLTGSYYPCIDRENNYFNYIVVDLLPLPHNINDKNILIDWGCRVHNLMNIELKKDEFDCLSLFDTEADRDEIMSLNKVTIEKEEKQLG